MPSKNIVLFSNSETIAHRLSSRLETKFQSLTICKTIREFKTFEGKTDCIIIDNTIPLFGALEIVQLKSGIDQSVPILVIVQPGDERLIVETMTVGVTDFVVVDGKEVYLDIIPIKIQRMLECAELIPADDDLEREDVTVGQLRAVLDAVPGMVSWISAEGKYIGANENLARIFGKPTSYFSGKPVGFQQMDQPFPKFVREFFESEKEYDKTELEVYLDGELFNYMMVAQKYQNNKAAVFVGIDMTDQKQAERLVRESAQKINNLHDIAMEMTAALSEAEIYQLTIDAAERILNFSYAHFLRVEDEELVTVATSENVKEGLGERMAADEGLAGKTLMTRETVLFSEREEVPEARDTGDAFESGISAPIGDLGVFQVLSEQPDKFSWVDAKMLELLLGHTGEALKRLELEKSLKDLAIRDPLTGLYNRNYLNLAIDEKVGEAENSSMHLGILVTDIKSLSTINSEFGRETGNRIIQIVAKIMYEESSEGDILVRYGGDEFLVITLGGKSRTDDLESRILNSLHEFNVLHSGDLGFEIQLAAGSAHWDPEGEEDFLDTLNNADQNMHSSGNLF